MKVSIVAPMFNEEANLQNTLSEIKRELTAHGYNDHEIIFVNDGSTDNTEANAKALAQNEPALKIVGYKQNQGRGKALRTGLDAATGDIICTIDFDLSYDIEHVTRMIKTLEEDELTDVVLASAYMPGGKTIGVAPFRLFISKSANYLFRYAYTPRIYTSTCVVRGYRKEVVDGLLLESNDKEIHLEILSKVLALGYRIKEIPGTLTKRKAGKSKFKFRSTSVSHLIHLVHEKPFLLFGIGGFFLMILGLIASAIIVYTRFSGDLEFAESYLGRLVSPNFVLILFIAGLQMLGIGFLGIQNNLLKRELYRTQREIKRNK